MSDKLKVGVLGAGTWGIALARMLSNAGKDVTVWSAVGAEIDSLEATGIHPKFPNIQLPKGIVYTKSIQKACDGMGILVFAVSVTFCESDSE